MQAGKLNSYVLIRKPTSAQDADGQPVETWVKVAGVWADIRYLNGVESIKSGQDVSVAHASIRIRWRTDVAAGMRAIFGTTVFDIRAVLPNLEDNQSVDLVCESGAVSG